MGMIALVHADFLKQRHTSYWGIHTVIPIAGAICLYFTSCFIRMSMN